MPKKYKVEPTERQKKAFQILSEEGKKKGEAMREAGYSEIVAKAPTRVTKTRGWEELLKRELPDEKLVKKHNYLLSSRRKEETQKSALDMAYKLKGSYAPERSQSLNLNINKDAKDNSRAKELTEEYEQKLKNQLIDTI